MLGEPKTGIPEFFFFFLPTHTSPHCRGEPGQQQLHQTVPARVPTAFYYIYICIIIGSNDSPCVQLNGQYIKGRNMRNSYSCRIFIFISYQMCLSTIHIRTFLNPCACLFRPKPGCLWCGAPPPPRPGAPPPCIFII